MTPSRKRAGSPGRHARAENPESGHKQAHRRRFLAQQSPYWPGPYGLAESNRQLIPEIQGSRRGAAPAGGGSKIILPLRPSAPLREPMISFFSFYQDGRERDKMAQPKERFMTQASTMQTPQPGLRPITRQFVNFACFKLNPEFRRLPNVDKETARAEFVQLFSQPSAGLLCLSYSTIGLRPDVDFVLWRISTSTDEFQSQTQAINRTRLGG